MLIPSRRHAFSLATKIVMLQAAGEDRFLAQRRVGDPTPPRVGLLTGWKRLTD
jgi:hypothetical protein